MELDLSFKLAEFLDDMDLEYNVFPDDEEGTTLEFSYEDKFYVVNVLDKDKLSVNGEAPITYRQFITDTF